MTKPTQHNALLAVEHGVWFGDTSVMHLISLKCLKTNRCLQFFLDFSCFVLFSPFSLLMEVSSHIQVLARKKVREIQAAIKVRLALPSCRGLFIAMVTGSSFVFLPSPTLQVSSHIQVLARRKSREFHSKLKVCAFLLLGLLLLCVLTSCFPWWEWMPDAEISPNPNLLLTSVCPNYLTSLYPVSTCLTQTHFHYVSLQWEQRYTGTMFLY